tara:strand:+ start:255 stop:2057 length:1803 start_codon:yes stop_codon:yes gene_type:complete
MAEKIVSPGVFTNEIDQTFLPSAVSDIGAALIGPTVKGPALVPTIVSSYSEFQTVFGDSFKSGSTSIQFLTSHTAEQYLKHSNALTVVRILDGAYSEATASIPTGSSGTPASSANSFKLHSLSDGMIMNNYDATARSNGILISGSKHNIRWEVSNINKKKGSFTLLVRRGDDTYKRKQILESWNNVNLDPKSPNYIAKTIGDQVQTLRTDENLKPFLQLSGSYANKSRYVRVSSVLDTIDYLDENGNLTNTNASASLPHSGSGSVNGGFGGATSGQSDFDPVGNHKSSDSGVKPVNFYENITQTNSQGFDLQTSAQGLSSYQEALDLLSNQDEYDINLILTPGVISKVHTTVANKVIDVCEDRADCFAILDPVAHASNVTIVTEEAERLETNFAAVYWPWVKINDTQISGTQRWVPPSVVMGGIFAFNDKVAHPWFAPAGLNRGGIDVAIQAERKLTQADRDTLYDSNVNPIATFPGQGVTVFGQKTLQKKASALDRINVRRLLIKVKKFIASSSRFLVFEQNTAATRRRFLGIVNPYLENVQSQSGLNAFRVVMDETNNTPDTIDRNYLVGQLFLQPTRTAEFIVLDFTIQPTGASFPE